MFSVSVMHAPWRPERVESLRSILAQIPQAAVLSDDKRDGTVRVDGRTGPWPIASRAWHARDPRATHHIVLEDDAELCNDFMEHTAEAVAARPDAAISLFKRQLPYSGVATVMPHSVIELWLPWADLESRKIPNYSLLISKGLAELKLPHLFTIPSLVQHRPGESLLFHKHTTAVSFEKSPTKIEFGSISQSRTSLSNRRK